jgi:anti-sigma regulatory factor (Ser/Thr protein kinase)
VPLTPAGFRHEALFYADEDEFLAGTLPFVRDALAGDGAVLVALRSAKTSLLKHALGAKAKRVGFADMERLGRNPGRIIPAWWEFVRDHAGDGRPFRGIGEPIWPGRTAAQLGECHRHEWLLNRAFDDGPAWWLLCPYDTEGLDPEVLEQARTTHRHVTEGGASHTSETYSDVDPCADPLPAPAAHATELAFGAPELPLVRHIVAERARAAGLRRKRLIDLVLAVGELAGNSVRHGGGRGKLRIWRENGTFLCEVGDRGRIADPLAGRGLFDLERAGGRGLWLVHHVCDLVEIRSSAAGTVVRVHMGLNGG